MNIRDFPKLQTAHKAKHRPKTGRGAAVKVKAYGQSFDSKAESRYYTVLCAMLEAGRIESFRCHPRIDLIVEGTIVCGWIPDYAYIKPGEIRCRIIEIKGHMEDDALLKIKLARALGYDITVLTKETNPELFRSRRRGT